MWGSPRKQQRAEDSRLRIFITSDFNKLESALKRATVTSDLGICKLLHKWPRSASVNKSVLFLQINGQRASQVQPGSFLMSPFMFLSWSKGRYTDRDIINRTSKVWTKWYFRWDWSPKIHAHLLARLDSLTRDCGRDNLKSLASLTVSCGKPLKQTCCTINYKFVIIVVLTCSDHNRFTHAEASSDPHAAFVSKNIRLSFRYLTYRGNDMFEMWAIWDLANLQGDMTNRHSNLQYKPQKNHIKLAE